MIVTVFGANGKVGRLVVRELLNNGYDVVAFVHRSSSFSETKKLKIVHGDIHNFDDVKGAVRGSEVIISALGSWGTKQKDIVSVGTKNIVEALKNTDTKRVITLTGADALVNDEKVGILDRALRLLIKLTPAREILNDGEQHISLLESSDLNWTIVRSPVMNNWGVSSKYILNKTKPKIWETINRQSVADSMIKLINDTSFYKQAPFINRG